jgi:putative DNA primase/helicase
MQSKFNLNEDLIQPVNDNGHFNSKSALLQHKKILKQLLRKVGSVDFLVLTGLNETKKVTNAHYHVVVIEEIIRLAEAHDWGLCRNNDFFYLYNGAYWNILESDELKTFLGKAAEKMGVDKYKARHFRFRDELFKQFIAIGNLAKPELDHDTTCINLLNGTFVITRKNTVLQKFDRKDFITYQLPFEYDLHATAPLFTTYLNKVLPDMQKQMVIAEFLGYIFVRPSTLKLEKTLMLYGSGANGKSVFYEIVRNLLGVHNVSEYSLQSLTDLKGYHRANLANKLLNYASEINCKLEASFFKQLVSGEPVEARLPYGNPFMLYHYAKFIFNCNELPKDVEQTEAYFRRFMIIAFDVTIPEEEQDKQLAQKIIATELSGIFNWVLEGLARLLAQGKFTVCDAVKQARKQYELESDSVKMFLEDRGYAPSANLYISLENLYTEYKEFCVCDGYRPVHKRNFSKRLQTANITIVRRGKGMVVFVMSYESLEK